MSHQAPDKNLPLKKKVLFLIIPVLLFLAGMEGILRLTVGLQQIRFRCHYPILSNQYCPNIVATMDANGEVIHANSVGLLDREYEKIPRPGVFRVAVLGDSFTAGEEVKDGFEFHEVWEKELTRRFNHPVEFINFGVGGIGTWRELQTYHLRAHNYQPDLTVLAFYWGNDVKDSYSKLKRGHPNPLKEEYPVESFKQRAQVIRKSFNQWLWNNVALYQFTHIRYRKLEYQFHQFFLPEWKQKPSPPAKIERRDRNKLAEKYPPLPGIKSLAVPMVNEPTSLDDLWFFDSDGWGLVKELLLKLKEEVEADGGKLILMHFMSKTQYLERHDLPLGEFNAFLKENSIGVIDPNARFLSMSEKDLLAHYVPDNIHFNEKGQQMLADYSMDYMETAIKKIKASTPKFQ